MEPYYMASQGEEDGREPNEDLEPGWMQLIKDEQLQKDFKFVYREFRLGNLSKYEAEVVHNLLAAALQLYLYEQEYNRKGVNLRLEDTVKIMLADAASIVVTSRSRGGFERKMQATTIQKVEQREIEEKKSRFRLFNLGGERL